MKFSWQLENFSSPLVTWQREQQTDQPRFHSCFFNWNRSWYTYHVTRLSHGEFSHLCNWWFSNKHTKLLLNRRWRSVIQCHPPFCPKQFKNRLRLSIKRVITFFVSTALLASVGVYVNAWFIDSDVTKRVSTSIAKP